MAAPERGPLGIIKRTVRLAASVDGVTTAVIGASLGVMVAAVNDGLTITSQIDQELARREQAGLLPPKPADDMLKSGANVIPTLEAEYIRPVYQQAVVRGERSVTIVFPDLMMERQAEFNAAVARRIRNEAAIEIHHGLTVAPTSLGFRRGNQDFRAGLTACLTMIGSAMVLVARAGSRNRVRFVAGQPTPATP